MKIAVKSDIGQVRSLNEDAAGYFYNRNQQVLMVLCDGIGGHNAGDVASAMALTHLGEEWEATTNMHIEEAHQWLIESIHRQNDLIYKKSQEFRDLKGMGTTLVAATVSDGELLVANVGDSRAYLLREYQLKQLTQDHTLVNELLQSGEITEEEARHHPQRNYVTRSIGVTYSVQIDFVKIHLKDEDRLLLCSDGLTNMVTDAIIQNILVNHASIEEQVKEAIDQANKAGGKDNITVLIAKYEGEEGDK